MASVTDADHGSIPVTGVSAAWGNIVLADQGRSIGVASDPTSTGPEQLGVVPAQGRFRPSLANPDLTFAAPPPWSAPPGTPQSAASWTSPAGTPVAAVALASTDGTTTAQWSPAPGEDLLAEAIGPASDVFIAEMETDGTAYLLFGDGTNGTLPVPGSSFAATYRVGNGTAGNVAREAVTLVDTDGLPSSLLAGVTNPLPAVGGVDPEPIDQVRQSAPAAFETQQRAVTAADYQALVAAYTGVQRAAATLRWTGSWNTVFITVERDQQAPLSASFMDDLVAYLDGYRMAGVDLQVEDGVQVPLLVQMTVCVQPGYVATDVEQALLSVFSAGTQPDGAPGLFNPGVLDLGQRFYLSPLIAAAQAVDGVASVQVTAFERQDQPSDEGLLAGVLVPQRLEFFVLANDPNYPERGLFELTMEGGLSSSTTPRGCGGPGGTLCGCYTGVTAETPATIDNRPGLSAISYRSGTWAQFKASLLAGLSTTSALGGLKVRSDDDFTIALLDAWAIACDILTFYQERIANESYLRTATELVSVGELAKLIGYKLRPGLAAAAPLAFTIDTPPPVPPATNPMTGLPVLAAASSTPPAGSPTCVALATGTKVQTVPDPGAQPATFETVAPISARAEWDAIGVRMTLPPAPVAANATANLRLAGLATTVKVGDMVLVRVPGAPAGPVVQLQRVAAVTPDTTTTTTVVQFEAGQDPQPASAPTAAGTAAQGASLDDDFLWAGVKGYQWSDQTQLVAFAVSQGWSVDDLEDAINALQQSLPPGTQAPVEAYAMGTDAALFGHNAMQFSTVPSGLGLQNWEGYTLATLLTSSNPWMDLDNVYPVVVGDWVALAVYFTPVAGELEKADYVPAASVGFQEEVVFRGWDGASQAQAVPYSSPGGWQVFPTQVLDVQVVTRVGYLMSSKVTSLSLTAGPPDPGDYGLRTTRVLVQTAQLQVAGIVVDDVVSAGPVTLDGAYLSLQMGQLVVLTGVRADKEGTTASEVVTISGLSLVDGYTVVTFTPQLAGTYVRASVTINANVAPATHGETTNEILGSGDCTQAFQSFALKQPPLTYVSAPTVSGSASTLTVTVNGVQWTEVEWLYGSQPTDPVYTVLLGPDGNTYVQFGDGVTGARPGTGTNNIVATYRHGTGSAGLARPGQISTLLSRPLGLKAGTNPLASSGAADPETIDQARSNAPISVTTLGRIVSLEDVGNFAAASAGIAKGAASWAWSGTRYVACVTVAGVGGAPVAPGTAQYTSLLQSMADASDGTIPITLCSYQPLTFTVSATITPDPSLLGADVLAAVQAALASTFSFSSRAFGQPVYASEVIAAVQDVPGVVAMTLTGFNYSNATPSPPATALPASASPWGPRAWWGRSCSLFRRGRSPGSCWHHELVRRRLPVRPAAGGRAHAGPGPGRGCPAGPGGGHRAAGPGRQCRARPALRRPVHRDLQPLGGPLHRGPDLFHPAPAARPGTAGRDQGRGGRHHRLPPSQGDPGHAGAAVLRRDRMARRGGGVLLPDVDHAVRPQPPAAGERHRGRPFAHDGGRHRGRLRQGAPQRRRASDGQWARPLQPAQHRPVRVAPPGLHRLRPAGTPAGPQPVHL